MDYLRNNQNISTPVLCLGLSNRKGRCAEDTKGNRLCGCPELQVQSCPKRDILSLHVISSMPEPVKRAVIIKVNLTRQGPGGRRWQPGKDAVICNIYYEDHQEPSRDNRNLVPVHFKRPSHHPTPPTQRRKGHFTMLHRYPQTFLHKLAKTVHTSHTQNQLL